MNKTAETKEPPAAPAANRIVASPASPIALLASGETPRLYVDACLDGCRLARLCIGDEVVLQLGHRELLVFLALASKVLLRANKAAPMRIPPDEVRAGQWMRTSAILACLDQFWVDRGIAPRVLADGTPDDITKVLWQIRARLRRGDPRHLHLIEKGPYGLGYRLRGVPADQIEIALRLRGPERGEPGLSTGREPGSLGPVIL